MESVFGGAHNPKVGGSNPPPATRIISNECLLVLPALPGPFTEQAVGVTYPANLPPPIEVR